MMAKSTCKRKKKIAPAKAPPPPSTLSKNDRLEEDPRYSVPAEDLEMDSAIMTGTDYGVVTFATTVAFIMPDLNRIVAIVAGDHVKLPKTTKTTTKDIQWRSGQLEFSKKLIKAKKANPEVIMAEKLLSEQAVSTSSTPAAVLERYARVCDSTKVMQSFDNAN
ncbi:hypothetical protein DM01DRAFT_1341480 [Hesseltinella vesiculosa]|uniref:Uncharacterized protein n=1 Tax=Hesseltinella vesiculosa TaxID=101127 RepID=A0A1X2GXQ9_9FUNG|nr:hypothetical protein DM01DRAFT_1341480 [Hesseltinella vesiculosa]